MRVLLRLVVVLAVTQEVGWVHAQQLQPPMPPGQLVREVVYNELHDHDRHGYWRYWIERHSQGDTRREEQVETASGPIARLDLSNGRSLDTAGQLAEQNHLNRLLSSPEEQARHRQAYADDEKRIGRIVALLPDAFLYEYAGEEGGCQRLHFRPNPDYPAHSIEARIFHSMSGELWVSSRYKRMARLDGHLEENVDFGFGILGRLYKGGWFQLQRTRVSPTDWKTERLEVHMSGRAMLFKTIARETSEVRGGFAPVPAGISLAQGVTLLGQAQDGNAFLSPAAFTINRKH
ncbi:MAG: hypothetical protein ABSE55_04540 [Terracidiphilus sp.]|jgi:hypothetical protein